MYAPWIASVFLFIALVPDLPYGYYQILRWIVCACACFTAYVGMEKEIHGWMGIFAVIAVLFNPILPIHLPREVWQPIDVVVGIIFLCSLGLFRKQKEEKSPHKTIDSGKE